MRKINILIPLGSRSELGLTAPIIKRMGADDSFEVTTCGLQAGNFKESYDRAQGFCNVIKPEWMLCVGDRIEMTAAACAAFHNNVKIAHYYGGVLNDPIATLDDINRHVISLWSNLQFVESYACANNISKILHSINKSPDIHIVGITHMDDLSLDISRVPTDPYNLVLYNPITAYDQEKNNMIMEKELLDIVAMIKGENTIFIYPNSDQGAEAIIKTYTVIPRELPRPQFLALLKYCKRFITNSSAAYYEAPFFLNKKQIIKIGERNRNRTNDSMGYNGAEQIIEVFKTL